ncbi:MULTISPECIES: hypothetical protein [Hahella]|uniref:Protein containing EF hand domain n=1 Tax=Hahella chejuensis (strain KCTC 2396) TaxID=349521 RepID=Q2S7S9_HAHCH|nr:MULTISPECIES: hypothetical protein [Hahella]ABC33295.1 protein containing EF hand domain [Hahella chejuensis KCTC 2396]AZZ95052.1 hypothetical protein ENC22_29180 [Hahella sp. KA22]MBU6951095.1 hypothetical protein [Hahella sp. HN01]MDG9666826.1 hypothetical protein [Hahella sp. CR1]QAY52697.1 hypothetical protein EUZ85_00890 [Hahella sp. KA22]
MKKIVAFALASVLAGPVLAEDTQTTDMMESEAEFVALDADKNGSISQEEAAADAGLAQSFAKADADQDGAVSKDEFVLYTGEATAAGQ